MPTTLRKSAAETYSIGFPYATKMAALGATAITASEVFASELRWHATTLALAAAAQATSLSVAAEVGRGAWLIVGSGLTQERVRVSTQSGVGPYAVGVSPALRYSHDANEPVRYEPGVTLFLLGNTAATVVDGEARVLIQNGVHGRRYRVWMRVTFDNNAVLEDECLVMIRG